MSVVLLDPPELPPVEETALPELLEVFFREYEAERNKKQSMESRAGLLLGFCGAYLVYLLENSQAYQLFATLTDPALNNWPGILRQLSLLGLYVGLCLSLLFLLLVLWVKPVKSVNLDIHDKMLLDSRSLVLQQLAIRYRGTALDFRESNESRARFLKAALSAVALTLASTAIYQICI